MILGSKGAVTYYKSSKQKPECRLGSVGVNPDFEANCFE
ncbi:hypothetical protein SLEP1_g15200 [Rubroshorea leprosula]|uniref:Uncharacterized protein n=1 Tax=Rubroshorea leprosula TaxID=152421 RepID=A0AAV5ISH2_9ROSI|nr:hypothetical protein SLEP1_g15200 [Rubroshorea leprosula]